MSKRSVTGTMNRRRFLGAASAGLALVARPMIARAETKEVLIAEPVHGTGYLPLYIGIAKNLFEDVTVKIVTIETGAGHTNAVLSGQAFAFIGGPEHCAYAKAKGAELRSVVNCVDRGNVYFCAEKGVEPTNTDWAAYVKGKTIATSAYGGTPNSITRYLLKTWNLDPTHDVTLVETANSAILPVVRNKQAQIGCSTEPFITQGVRSGVWDEPFINIPKMMGPYAYSTFNVRLDSVQKTPELVQRLRPRHDEVAEIRRRRTTTRRRQSPRSNSRPCRSTTSRRRSTGPSPTSLWSKDGIDQPGGMGHRQEGGDGRGPSEGRRQI